MTSPYSSNLLQHSGDTATAAHDYPYAPQLQQPPAPQHTAPVQQVVRYAPQQAPVQYAPQQPIYVAAPPVKRGGSAITGLAIALIVILLGAVALVGGYYATKTAAPSALEAQTMIGIASDSSFVEGRLRGTEAGKAAAAQAGETKARLTAALARENAFNKAYAQGLTAGNKIPRSRGYRYSGYRGNGIRYSGPTQVQSALGYAQNLANQTGAPVDVEVY